MVLFPDIQGARGPQLARWLEKLQKFQFRFANRPGQRHTNADVISQRPCDQCGRFDDSPGSDTVARMFSVLGVSSTIKATSGVGGAPPAGGERFEERRQLQLDDPDIKLC